MYDSFGNIRNFDDFFLLGWGIILSKKNLVRYATSIREGCPMCHILRSHDHPVILSACLISMETHPLLTVLPESFEFGEMRGTQPSNNTTAMQNTGQVLNDVSVTHILTLPTSASVQVRERNDSSVMIDGTVLFSACTIECSNTWSSAIIHGSG